MTERIEQRRLSLIHGALLGVVAALIPLLYLRGFTVDDALILARYAVHLARGMGYRFNPHGRATDGATPLGFPLLLVPFARGGIGAAFQAARALGALSWLVGSATLGAAVARSSRRCARWLALAIVMTSGPVAAWSVSGMETGLALGLATAAVCLPSTARYAVMGSFLSGLLAWLRPEALPFSVVTGVGRMRSTRGVAQKAFTLALSVLPFTASAVVRQMLWGRPYPLSLLAKPSDLQHGLSYTGASMLLSAGAVMLMAPCFWRVLGAWPRTLVVACAAHASAVTLAGGDWMPLSRLYAPIVPVIALIAAHELSACGRLGRLAAMVLALAVMGEVFAVQRVGRTAAHVVESRRALIAAAEPALRPFAKIATVDIGWVGASTQTDILDLAGVTDPEMAILPGGHTSKRVTASQLAERGVDAILVWLDPGKLDSGPIGTAEIAMACRRAVERNLLQDSAIQQTFALVWISPDDLPIRYALLARKDGAVHY